MRALLIVCLLVAGCGGEDPAPAAKKTAASPEQQAGDVALRYVNAVANADWEAACETRTETEQRDMAKLAGSCAKAFATMFNDKPVKLFEGVEVGDVRVKGTMAGVDLVHPGQTEPATTLAVVRDNGEWRLQDVVDSEIP